MRAVAIWRRGGLLAAAKTDFSLLFLDHHAHGLKSGTCMRAIAIRLFRGVPASAPEINAALEGKWNRLSACDDRLFGRFFGRFVWGILVSGTHALNFARLGKSDKVSFFSICFNAANVDKMLKTHVSGRVAFACLNRPEALNTLNLELVTRLRKQLAEWHNDSEVAVIVLRGEGPRAFCAGGDVKTVCLEIAKGNASYGTDFFKEEYRLDYAIHESLKPIVVVAHGFTMGGGIGLLAGASCRVVTSSSVLSMPELAIGFFSDVGASYFLADLPGRLGLFLALTGTRLNAADAIFAGMADFFISDARIADFCALLEATTWSHDSDANRRQLKARTKTFSKEFASQLPPAQLKPLLAEINAALAGNDPRASMARLLKMSESSDALLSGAATAFKRGSPTSAFLIFEQTRRGSQLSLAAALRMELDLATNCCRGHDFPEGVRALLIDKDQKPNWQPAMLEEVTDNVIAGYFNSPWPTSQHPLKDL